MGRQAIILAGGQGTRLKERLGDLPKPMIPIGGKPLLEHHLELAVRHGFKEVAMFICHGADLIRNHFGDGRRFGVNIEYMVEERPLGTAGAVLAGEWLLHDRFLMLYGDTMVHLDLERLWRAHGHGQKDSSQAWDATLVAHPNDHPLDSDLIEADAWSRIVGFHHRPHPPGVWRSNLVNAALYVLEKRALLETRAAWADYPAGEIVDFGRDIFPRMLTRGMALQAYNTPEYIKDIGTPERYDRVCAEWERGVIAQSSLEHAQRAVFLDRDGTLVEEKDCLRTADELELLPGAAEAVRLLNHHGWRTIVVTNQPVVAKGWATEEEVGRMHAKMETLLGMEHAFVDRIYYCPHHPKRGFQGERPELKIACDCRKPAPGMIDRGREDLHVDLARSWMVGDSTTDLETAARCGVRSVLVRTGHGGRDGKYEARPTRVCENLLDAVRYILEHSGA